MPVALAMPATERSISAQRMTKVRPTAMMPVTDTCVRMLPRLSSVAKEGLASRRKRRGQIRVTNGAMLRIWSRRKAQPPRGRCRRRPSHCSPWSSPSRRLQQAVLADRLVGEFARPSRPCFITRMRSASDSTVSGSVESTMTAIPWSRRARTISDVVLGADIHAARRLAQHQQLRRVGQPFASATFCWLPPESVPSARSTIGGRICSVFDLARGDVALRRRLEQQREMRSRMLIEMFL